MKLPNGYGSVYKLSGRRRKPYIARKTAGWTEEGKQQYTTIGYYESRQKALQALADYNDNPYDIELSKVTFTEIYERWYADEFNEQTNPSTRRDYEAAYKYCEPLYLMKMADIRPQHMQDILDSCSKGYQTVKRIHILFNKLFRWCIEHDCIKKNYAERVKVNVKSVSEPRTPFSTDEITKLWAMAEPTLKNPEDDNQSLIYIGLVLILIYSGVRINELLTLHKTDVNLDEQWFRILASKTNSGIRIVPIADKVVPFWKRFLDMSQCEYAVCTIEGKQLTYDNFRKNYWNTVMQKLNMIHTIHETRHTCISQLTMKNANPTIIKKIVGHKSVMSLTERVYTHIEIQELLNTINLI